MKRLELVLARIKKRTSHVYLHNFYMFHAITEICVLQIMKDHCSYNHLFLGTQKIWNKRLKDSGRCGWAALGVPSILLVFTLPPFVPWRNWGILLCQNLLPFNTEFFNLVFWSRYITFPLLYLNLILLTTRENF